MKIHMDGHEFREILNYDTPTGYYVCANIECGYSLVGGDWKWYDMTTGDLVYVLEECPAPIERPIRWKVSRDEEVLFIRGPQSPSDGPDTHA